MPITLEDSWNGAPLKEVEEMLREEITALKSTEGKIISIKPKKNIIPVTGSDDIGLSFAVSAKKSDGEPISAFKLHYKFYNPSETIIVQDVTGYQQGADIVIKNEVFEHIKEIRTLITGNFGMMIYITTEEGEDAKQYGKETITFVQYISEIHNQTTASVNPQIISYNVRTNNESNFVVNVYRTGGGTPIEVSKSIFTNKNVADAKPIDSIVTITVPTDAIKAKLEEVSDWYGVHKVEAYFDFGENVTSQKESTDYVFYDGGSDTGNINPIIYVDYDKENATHKENLTLNYRIYLPNHTQQEEVEIEVGYKIPGQTSYNNIVHKGEIETDTNLSFDVVLDAESNDFQFEIKKKILSPSQTINRVTRIVHVDAKESEIKWNSDKTPVAKWSAKGSTFASLSDAESVFYKKWKSTNGNYYMKINNPYSITYNGFKNENNTDTESGVFYGDFMRFGQQYQLVSDEHSFAPFNDRDFNVFNNGGTLSFTFVNSGIGYKKKVIIDSSSSSGGHGLYMAIENNYLILGYAITGPQNYTYLYQVQTKDKSGTNYKFIENNVPYNIIITIGPNTNDGKYVTVYINGELSAKAFYDKVQSGVGLSDFNGSRSFLSDNIGDYLDIYNVAYYTTSVSPIEAMIIASQSLNELKNLSGSSIFTKSMEYKDIYHRNKYQYDGTYDKRNDASSAIEYGKYLAENLPEGETELGFAVVFSTDLGNVYSVHYDGWVHTDGRYGVNGNTSGYAHDGKSPQDFYIFKFKKDENGKGIIDADKTYWIHGDDDGKDVGLRIRRQGTSTKDSIKGNVRIDVYKKGAYLHKFDNATGKFQDTSIYYGKGGRIFDNIVDSTNAFSLLTMKKNPNESTHTRNLPTSKLYEDGARALYQEYGPKYKSLLTPPQILDPSYRQCIDGIPAIAFTVDRNGIKNDDLRKDILNVNSNYLTFSGQFDLITDKANQEIFGFGYNSSKEDFSIEFRSNESAVCNFHTSRLYGKDYMYTEKGNDKTYMIEYRYPSEFTLRDVSSYILPEGESPEDWEDGTFEIDHPVYGEDVYAKVQVTKNGTTIDVSINGTIGFKNYPDASYRAYEPGGVSVGDSSYNYLLDTMAQRFFDFVCNCSLHNVDYKYINGKESLSGGVISIEGEGDQIDDSSVNRLRKFKKELYHYVDVNQILYNGIMMEWALMIDQETKNQFFTHYKGDINSLNEPIFRLLAYDMDTTWGMDNANNVSHGPLELYSDGLYDGNHNPNSDGIGNGSGRGSDFWELVYKAFDEQDNTKPAADSPIGEIVTDLLDISRNPNYKFGLRYADLIRYFTENQINLYNELIFNNNAEYSYIFSSNEKAGGTENISPINREAQLSKIHGSDISTLSVFLLNRCKLLQGKYFLPGDSYKARYDDYTKDCFVFRFNPDSSTSNARWRLPNNLKDPSTLDLKMYYYMSFEMDDIHRGYVHYIQPNGELASHGRDFADFAKNITSGSPNYYGRITYQELYNDSSARTPIYKRFMLYMDSSYKAFHGADGASDSNAIIYGPIMPCENHSPWDAAYYQKHLHPDDVSIYDPDSETYIGNNCRAGSGATNYGICPHPLSSIESIIGNDLGLLYTGELTYMDDKITKIYNTYYSDRVQYNLIGKNPSFSPTNCKLSFDSGVGNNEVVIDYNIQGAQNVNYIKKIKFVNLGNTYAYDKLFHSGFSYLNSDTESIKCIGHNAVANEDPSTRQATIRSSWANSPFEYLNRSYVSNQSIYQDTDEYNHYIDASNHGVTKKTFWGYFGFIRSSIDLTKLKTFHWLYNGSKDNPILMRSILIDGDSKTNLKRCILNGTYSGRGMRVLIKLLYEKSQGTNDIDIQLNGYYKMNAPCSSTGDLSTTDALYIDTVYNSILPGPGESWPNSDIEGPYGKYNRYYSKYYVNDRKSILEAIVFASKNNLFDDYPDFHILDYDDYDLLWDENGNKRTYNNNEMVSRINKKWSIGGSTENHYPFNTNLPELPQS